MGDDAYARLCLISSGAQAVSHPTPTTYLSVLFLGEMLLFLPLLLLSLPLLPLSLPSCRCCRHCATAAANAMLLPPLLPRCCQAAAATAITFAFIVVVVAVIIAVSVAVAVPAFS